MTTLAATANVRRNMIANLIGSGWAALLTLAVVPVYLRLLGPELYGLVGFYTTLQMLSLVVERGLGTAVNREVAQMEIEGGAVRVTALLRTLEMVYWSGALVIGVVTVAAAPIIAKSWLRPERVSEDLLSSGVAAMGICLAVQFPFGLYSGVLLGLQRHVRYNVVVVTGTTVRLLLPVAVLRFTGTNIVLFFALQAAAAAVQTIVGRELARRELPRGDRQTGVANLRGLAPYATQVTLLTALTVVVLQSDRLIISYVATLEEFGRYAVAAAAATGLGVVSLPVYTAVFPRFSQLFARDDEKTVRELYHHSTQVNSALIAPVAGVVIAFAYPLLLIWTRDAAVAAHAALPLALLAGAVCANSLTYVAQALQLAAGWTKFVIGLHAVGIAALIPAGLFAARNHGVSGVASVVLAWHVLAAVVTAIVIDRVFLRASAARWFLTDVGRPIVATAVVVVIARVVAARVPEAMGPAFIALTAIVAGAASLMSSQELRCLLRQRGTGRGLAE